MGKKNSKNVKINNSSAILPLLILAVLVYGGFRFISNQSNINLNKRNDAVYENNLKASNYAYMEDIGYKKDIVKSSKKYSLKQLAFLMGPQELKQYITKYDDDYLNYAYGQYNPPAGTYTKQKLMRANLNIHTMLTDGHMEIPAILEQAAQYGDIVASNFPNQKYIIAISDLDSVDYAPIVIETINANPEKYKNLRVVFGIEISTNLEANDYINEVSKVNILALCINPFESEILKYFPNKSLFSSGETDGHDFDEMVSMLNSQTHTIYGIARPLKEFAYISDKQNYIKNLFKYYITQNEGFKFVESYYDPYTYSSAPEVLQMKQTVDDLKLHKVGSLSDYGDNLFEY